MEEVLVGLCSILTKLSRGHGAGCDPYRCCYLQAIPMCFDERFRQES